LKPLLSSVMNEDGENRWSYDSSSSDRATSGWSWKYRAISAGARSATALAAVLPTRWTLNPFGTSSSARPRLRLQMATPILPLRGCV